MIISIAGKIGSGKDTIANIFQCLWLEEHFLNQGKHVNFSANNFNDLISLFEREYRLIGRYNVIRFADKIKLMVSSLLSVPLIKLEDREFKETSLGEKWNNLTPRVILQLLGTECGRNIIHPDIWVNSTLSHIKNNEDYIIPDLRFKNEYNALKKLNSYMIKVIKYDIIDNNHNSENDINDITEWDAIVINSGSMQELIDQIRVIYQQIKPK